MSAGDSLEETKKQPTEPEAPALEAYLAEEPAAAETPAPKPKQRRGFAIIDRERHRELSRRGGVAAQASGHAHRFDSEEGKVAGRKGGFASRQARAAAHEGKEGDS